MDVLMPQLGETVTEGTVAAWHKEVGDTVQMDETILDVETDKVSMEIPAPGAGTLAQILVASGETVEVGTVLAVIAGAGETIDAADTNIHPSPAGPAAASAAPEPRPPPEASSSSSPTVVERSDQVRLSPAVRRLVAEHQVELGSLQGSGRNSRITRRDVIEHLAARDSKPSPAVTTAPTFDASPAAASSSPRSAAPSLGAATIPFTRIRKLTADHMLRSKATSAHVLQAVEVDFSGVERVRSAMREAWRAQRGYSLTYLPFIGYSVCRALAEFPHANASVQDDTLIVHEHVNLGIAIDLGPEGLVAPVIRSAEKLSVTQLAEAIHDLAARARGNGLKPDDLSGGTYTLSNNGSFGTLITAPIINQPQVAILSTDGVRKKPVVVEHPSGDSIAIRPVGILAQSFDHRAIDGAYSGAFLDRVRKLLEQTDWYREV